MKSKLIILVTAIVFILAGCGSKPTLSQWVKGDDVKTMLDAANQQLAGAGMTMDISADGDDILVYSYICDKEIYGEAFASLSESDFEETFASVIAANSAQFTELRSSIKSELGIELSAIRFEVIIDGKVLYSTDVK